MGQIRPHVGQPHSMAFLCRTSCLALTMCSLMWLLSASVISSLVRVLHRVAQRAASATQPVEPRALSTLLSALQPECDVDAPSGIQGLKHCLSSPFHGTWWWYEKIYIYISPADDATCGVIKERQVDTSGPSAGQCWVTVSDLEDLIVCWLCWVVFLVLTVMTNSIRHFFQDCDTLSVCLWYHWRRTGSPTCHISCKLQIGVMVGTIWAACIPAEKHYLYMCRDLLCVRWIV